MELNLMLSLINTIAFVLLVIFLYYRSGMENFNPIIENRPQICHHCILGRCRNGRCYGNSV